MKEQLQQRLRELKAEFESGQKMLADLENRQANLRSSLLRISGAILVLEEELDKYNGNNIEALQQQSLNSEESIPSEPVELETQSDTG